MSDIITEKMPEARRRRIIPALVNALACSAGSAWLVFDLSSSRYALLAGVAGGVFGFLNRFLSRDSGHGTTKGTPPSITPVDGASVTRRFEASA